MVIRPNVRIYTDGSCRDRIGGWAFIVQATKFTTAPAGGGAAEDTTNNRMELEAIYHALRWADRHIKPGENVCIVSDSRTSLVVIQTMDRHNYKNFDLVTLCRDHTAKIRSKGIAVNFEWIKGHVPGNTWNTFADRIASRHREGLERRILKQLTS